MPNEPEPKETEHPLLKTLWHTVTTLVSGAKPWAHLLRAELDGQLVHYADRMEKRLADLALRGLAFLVSVLLLGAGCLFVAIDDCGVPRSIACLGAGFLGLLSLFFWIQFKKYNQGTSPKG